MFHRILVPIDGSDTSTKALVAATNLARDSGGRIRLLHRFDPLDYMTGYEMTAAVYDESCAYARKVLDDGKAICDSAGVPCETFLSERVGERLGETVAQDARQWEADLVVVGTQGRRGLGRLLLGSGAEQVIRLAPVPVLAVR